MSQETCLMCCKYGVDSKTPSGHVFHQLCLKIVHEHLKNDPDFKLAPHDSRLVEDFTRDPSPANAQSLQHTPSFLCELVDYSTRNGMPCLLKMAHCLGADIHEGEKNLLKSIKKGHFEIAHYLLDNGAQVSVHGREFLESSAENGNLPLARCLIERGVEICNDDYPLEASAKHGHLKVVECLVEHGARINDSSRRILQLSIKHGHISVVEYLNDFGPNTCVSSRDSFFFSATKLDLKIMQHLAEQGADIDSNIEYAFTTSAEKGNTTVAEYLFSRGAGIQAANQALSCSINLGNLQLAEYLVTQGARIHALNSRALKLGANKGGLKLLKYLDGRGVDICANGLGFYESAKNGHQSVVEYLLERGASDCPGNEGALHASTQSGHFNVVKCLIEHGANTGIVSEQVLNALFESGHLQALKHLAQNGGDLDGLICYALRLSAEKDHFDAVVYMLDRGANINANKDLISHLCIKPVSFQILRLFFERAADICASDLASRWTAENGHLQTVDYPSQHCVDIDTGYESLLLGASHDHLQAADHFSRQNQILVVNDYAPPFRAENVDLLVMVLLNALLVTLFCILFSESRPFGDPN